MKQVLLTTVFVVAIMSLIAGIILGSRSQPSQDLESNQALSVPASSNSEIASSSTTPELIASSEDILYWGVTCPHCHDTIEWIEQNEITSYFPVVQKEVYNNQANALELTEHARLCGMDTQNIGVPLMYTRDGRCVVGTPEITGYLAARVHNILNESPAASSSAAQ